jgi:two-component system chemotaxis response regulator CheY
MKTAGIDLIISDSCQQKTRLVPGFFMGVWAVNFPHRKVFCYYSNMDSTIVDDSQEGCMEKRKARILIADDEPHIRNLIGLIVTSLGAEVVAEAADGEQALKMYKQFSPDMVLLDINMPRMDGVAVLKQIMAINNKTLVVMLTSLSALEVVKECIDNGAWNYILKNTTAEELHKAIGATWGEYMAEIRAFRAVGQS